MRRTQDIGVLLKKLMWPVLALCALSLAFVVFPEAARAACGDGILDGNEECDGGPGGLFVDGDPANDACASGARCYFEFTCCKFNCQYVGTPGVPCQDGDSCSGPDACNQLGSCIGGPSVANGTPCDDGLFCTGVEECQNGVCGSPSGDPCPGTACNVCQEDTDTCFNPNGSPCSDGSGCISGGTCDGAGACIGGVPAEGPCNDGIFCNGSDSCGGGACSVHTGDPCPGSDGDGNCAESCDEATDTCIASDPEATACDDGLFCNGADDTCVAGTCSGTGTPSCDDGNSCTTDVCDEMSDLCSPLPAVDGTACSDGEPCTLDDVCQANVCTGTDVLLDDLCPWTVVLRENAKADQIRTNFQTVIGGDVCGGTIKLSDFTHVTSDIVSAEATGTGQIRLAPDVIVGNDIASGGAGARAFPGSGDLPYTGPAVSTLAPGSLTAKSDASGFYDLTGTHDLVADCNAARTGFAARAAALDALPASASEPAVNLRSGESLTITAAVPGALNVIDIDGSVKVGKDAILELSGGGSADTVVVLRVSGKFSLLLRSSLSLTSGLSAQNTLIYVKGSKCLLADLSIGGGTMFCSPARLKTGRTVAWVGTLIGDGKLLKIGEKNTLLYQPFQGL